MSPTLSVEFSVLDASIYRLLRMYVQLAEVNILPPLVRRTVSTANNSAGVLAGVGGQNKVCLPETRTICTRSLSFAEILDDIAHALGLEDDFRAVASRLLREF